MMTNAMESTTPSMERENGEDEESIYSHTTERPMSTEEKHSSSDMNFYGAYAPVRKTLDYTYHKNYKDYRQGYQDAIISDLLVSALITDVNGDVCTTPTEPWIVFTAGAMGAGKGHTIAELVTKKRFPLLAFVKVDPDEIRQFLPEYMVYATKFPLEAGELTRKEAGFISEILTLAALRAGKNVLVDGSLRDWEWYKIYFARLRKEYPSLKIGILHVTAPREAVLERAKQRGEITGRVVPLDVLENSLIAVPKSYAILSPLADYVCELNNAPGQDEVQISTPREDWTSFTNQWLQTCAWVPGKTKMKLNGELQKKKDEHKKKIANGNETKKNDNKAAMDAVGEETKRQFAAHMLRRRSSVTIRMERLSRAMSMFTSTDENFRSNDLSFYGPNAHLRKILDYQFHCNYVKERQWLQDSIIEEIISLHKQTTCHVDHDQDVSVVPKRPWVIYTAGVRGAGKNHVIRKLYSEGKFPLLPWIRSSLDEIRRHLPEFEVCEDDFPEMARQITAKESGYISELLTLAALHAGRNVHVDSSLTHADWYEGFFRLIRKENEGARIAILHVTAPLEDILRRSEEAAKKTGIPVVKEKTESILRDTAVAIDSLSQHVDYVCNIYNPDDGDMTILTEGENWDSFHERFVQSDNWQPGMWKNKLEEIKQIYVGNAG